MFDTLAMYKDLVSGTKLTSAQAEVVIDALRALDRNLYNFDPEFWALRFKESGFKDNQAKGIAKLILKMSRAIIKQIERGPVAA